MRECEARSNPIGIIRNEKNESNGEKMKNNKREKKSVSLVVYLHNVQNEVITFFENVIPVFEEKFEQSALRSRRSNAQSSNQRR